MKKMNKEMILRSVVGVAIVGVLMALGLWIGGNIKEGYISNKAEYDSIQVLKYAEELKYVQNGKIVAYGALSAVDTVKYDAVDGEFIYIEKETEEYRRHTRVVHVDGKTRTRVTHRWDNMDTENKYATQVSFGGEVFSGDVLKVTAQSLLTVEDASNSKIRYNYSGVANETVGTLVADVEDGEIVSAKFDVKTVEETMKDLKPIDWTVFFAVCWSIATGLFVFFYGKNIYENWRWV